MSNLVMCDAAGNVRREQLRRRIEALEGLLAEQGALVRKQRRGQVYWYLRYYETGPAGRKQRSLYVGGEDDARYVEALLVELRAPREFLRETLRLAELARHVARPLLRRRTCVNVLEEDARPVDQDPSAAKQ